MTTSSRHIVVGEYANIESAPDVDDRDKHRVATIFTEQEWDYVVWVPGWLLEDKDVETVEASDHLAVGDVVDYSERAWAISQPHLHTPESTEFLPKSQAVIFERLPDVEAVETPQSGLAAFAGGGDTE